jgi:intein/homing endonuclease
MSKLEIKSDVSLPPYVVNDLSPVRTQSETIDWCMSTLQIPRIHSEFGLYGKGVRVAVIDTGVHIEHEDLKGAVESFHNTTSEPYAWTNSHGTGVASLIAARKNDMGIYSVAPECKIVAIKALSESGSGNLADITKAVNLAIDQKVDVINMSLGGNQGTPELYAAIQKALANGIHVVCAAGNSGGENTVGYPARYPETVSVGATNQQNKTSAFSSRGPEVDIAAPGERILVAWKNGGYATVSGTCIRGDQWVHTEDGYKEISKIDIGDKVYTLNEETQEIELRSVTNKMSNGIKTVYNVKTTNGEIVCTDNHPFYQAVITDVGERNSAGQRNYNRDFQWSQLKDLSDGDVILMSQIKHDTLSSDKILNKIKEKLPKFNTNTAYAMGYWLGDGWYGTNDLVVYAKLNFWNELNDRFAKAFPENEIKNTYREDRNEYNIHVRGGVIKDLFKELGFHSGAKNKEIPAFVFGLPKEYREALLAGLFDSDGTINEHENGRNACLKVSSKSLAKGFKKLMESLGIRCSNIHEQTREGGQIGGRQLPESTSYSSTTYQFYKLQPLKKYLLDDRYVEVLDKNNDDTLSQNSVGRIKVNGIKVRPAELENEDLYYGKIVQIEEIGEDEVWDITVEGNHNFLCENFIVHNSFSSPILAGCYALISQAGIKMNHTILKETAIDIEEPGFDTKSGYGLFNPYEIIKKYYKKEVCLPVTNVNISTITDSSAKINWSPVNGASYVIELFEGSNSVNVQKTSNPTLDINGLKPKTIYNVKIRTSCSTNNVSDVVGGSFTTKEKNVQQKTDLTQLRSAVSIINDFINKNS